jgi:hypothetical protein
LSSCPEWGITLAPSEPGGLIDDIGGKPSSLKVLDQPAHFFFGFQTMQGGQFFTGGGLGKVSL